MFRAECRFKPTSGSATRRPTTFKYDWTGEDGEVGGLGPNDGDAIVVFVGVGVGHEVPSAE